MIEGAPARHPVLAKFDIVQEMTTDAGHKILLGKGKSGGLSTIKVLVEGRAIPEDVASALSKEGSAAARLTHDAIVQTRALVLEDDVAAIVTEFVDGPSLQRLLRFATGRGVRLPDEAGFYIVERVCSALAAAHDAKDGTGSSAPIAHRGVSPSAIVVGWDGTVKLGDFGLARLRFLVAPLLKAPEPASTPLMSPEQARGTPGTPRSDVYCAALLASRIATGRTPYASVRKSAAQLMLDMSEGKVVPLSRSRPDLPDAVKEAFARALEPDPDKRKVTAGELAEAVRKSFDLEKGKKALAKILERWRAELGKTVTPWEKRASITDATAATAGIHEGALMLANADERPSVDAMKAAGAGDEPWKKKDDDLPKEAAPLPATDPVHSMSRVGAVAEDVLSMPPALPAMRVTMPSIPVYGGPVAHLPPPPEARPKVFSGKVAAAAIFMVFAALVVAAIILLKWLSGPS